MFQKLLDEVLGFLKKHLLKAVLARGLAWLQEGYESKKEEIEKMIADFIPGKFADNFFIKLSQNLAEEVIEGAKKYLESIGAESIADASDEQIEQALAFCTSSECASEATA